MARFTSIILLSFGTNALFARPVSAQADKGSRPDSHSQKVQTLQPGPLSLVGSDGDQDRRLDADQEPARVRSAGSSVENEPMSTRAAEHVEKTENLENFGYKEVSSFFNIREANPQVDKGEWEFEQEMAWFTSSNGEDDEVGMAQSVKYGFTDDFFIELEVVEGNLGDGANQGNGDLEITLFQRLVRESDTLPALGLQGSMRVPTGDGSSGVDGTLSLIATKTVVDKCRVHLEGSIETANGAPDDDENRRHFQWALGPGFDYQIDDQTLALVNYLMKCGEDYGDHNSNILEFGIVREILHQGDIHSHVKLATDIGLDGQDVTPNFGAKFQWSIDWK